MGRSGETYNKKEVRKKKEKKKKVKAEKREARKSKDKKSSMDDMIAYVDENGVISSTPPDQEKEEVDENDIEIGTPKQSAEDKRDTLKQGRLSYFNESKGYGFIKDLETRNSVFVHINDMLDDDIVEGNIVSYKAEKGKRGPVAKQVKLYKD